MAEFPFHTLSGLKEAYERDGYAIVRQVLDPVLVAELGQHIEWLRARHPQQPTELLGHTLIANDPFWVRFIGEDRLLDVAAQIIGPNIAFFAADYICKAPGAGRPVNWHQDGNYWPLEPMDVVTIWFAVSQSGPHNGGVRVIPGSHKAGHLNHVESDAESANILGQELDPTLLEESKAVDIVLDPGDISMHHPYTLHGSQRNTSELWRKGGSIQYIPPTTRINDEQWPCSFFLRGEPVNGINKYRAGPKYVAGKHMAFHGCEDWV